MLIPIWANYDDLKIEGATLVNASFETLTDKGLPEGWKCVKANVVSDASAAAGNNYVRACFNKPVIQRVLAKAGQLVTITVKVRKDLLERLPNLAFIGTHSALHGYSHAGEGGNSTGQVLARMAAIPDCPYYHLLIGTNNNNVKTADQIPAKSSQTAEEIIQIVQGLLKKKGTEKVFLASILPCATDNPLRDQCNSAANTILREKFDAAFPKGKVVWVEYENPIRATSDWENKILLHPNEEGYALIAGITSEALRSALTINPAFTRPEKSGVRVMNLMGNDQVTVCPVIAGWYLFSCKLDGVTGQNPEMILESQSPGKDALREIHSDQGSAWGDDHRNDFYHIRGLRVSP